MSLDYAILGFLNYMPATGYELKKTFDVSIRHFWSADQSQIYRTLARLTEQGLAEVHVVEQNDRPDRKVYSITPAGRQELHAWLAGPTIVNEPRSAALVQVFFSGQLSDEEILAKFEAVAAVYRQILARYAELPALSEDFLQKLNQPRERFFWLLTLDLGIRSMRTELEWAEMVIRQIKEKQVPAGRPWDESMKRGTE